MVRAGSVVRYVTTVRQAELEGVYIGGSPAPASATPVRSAQAVGGDAQVELDRVARPESAVRERVESLDALRGLMALAVVIYHIGAWTRVFSGALRDAVIVLGVYSVEGFFVISGFCFFHLYGGRGLVGTAPALRGGAWSRAELGRFYAKRWLRLAPLYYVAMAFSLAFEPIYQAVFSWGRLLENLSLTFGLFHPNHSFVVGGWSIGLEVVFYLALPALLWLGRRRWALYLLAALLFAWSWPYAFGKVEAAAELRRFHVYVQLPNHAFLFVVGAIIADLRTRQARRLPLLGAVAAAIALGWLALALQRPVVDHFEVMVGDARLRHLCVCCALVLLFAFVRWPASRWLLPFSWLGDRSYALYLMHPVAWMLLRDRVAPGLTQGLQAVVALLAVFLLAEVAHRAVERPAQQIGQRLTTR